jgi:hypothetical protein
MTRYRPAKYLKFNEALPNLTFWRRVWEWLRVRVFRKQPRYSRVIEKQGSLLTVDRLPSNVVNGGACWSADEWPTREDFSKITHVQIRPKGSKL